MTNQAAKEIFINTEMARRWDKAAIVAEADKSFFYAVKYRRKAAQHRAIAEKWGR